MPACRVSKLAFKKLRGNVSKVRTIRHNDAAQHSLPRPSKADVEWAKLLIKQELSALAGEAEPVRRGPGGSGNRNVVPGPEPPEHDIEG